MRWEPVGGRWGHRCDSQGRKWLERSPAVIAGMDPFSVLCLAVLPALPPAPLEDPAACRPRGARNKCHGSGGPSHDQQPSGHRPGVEPSIPAHCGVGVRGSGQRCDTDSETQNVRGVSKRGIHLMLTHQSKLLSQGGTAGTSTPGSQCWSLLSPHDGSWPHPGSSLWEEE